MINAGWANSCGIELFTLGWVRCAEVVYGGSQFQKNPLVVFRPIIDSIKDQIQVRGDLVDYYPISDTELEIDGKKYVVVPQQTPDEIINGLKDVAKVLERAAKELGSTKDAARKELYTQIADQIKASDEMKATVFNDDNEILMILVAADEL